MKAEYALVSRRMAARQGHYMPVTLLQSQFDTLEEPAMEESPLTFSIEATPDEIVATIIARLMLGRNVDGEL